ncbi:Hypothetical protein CINCED_3A002955 [Cinara cedri]|uniref:alpha-glucosidase n=1 Tax=Cinara cedri TaxID=506608 RepID=A0A5E4MZQ7_9HEMI|nr:Hypothetical protein CINCED_3A002955 [Cinara cedri]
MKTAKMALAFFVILFVFGFSTGNTEPVSFGYGGNFTVNLWKNHKRETYSGYLNINSIIEGKIKRENELDWWQKAVIYQIYPRSFKDTTGNGVGDIQGVIEKIPYMKYLGIEAVWLCPINPSGGVDLGYDITDYKNIDNIFGTMEDIDELITRLHENGIKFLLDFVPNHTSDKHEWFVKSVQKIEPYTNYYVWADAKYVNETRQVPNNWLSPFFGTMWEWNEQRQQYYLHQFYKKQPDLNYWCPLVQKEIKDVLRFWLNKGVDGFRVDAVQRLYERQDLKDSPAKLETDDDGYFMYLNETYEEVISWRAVLDEYTKNDVETKFLMIDVDGDVSLTNRFYGNSTHPGAHFSLSFSLGKLSHKPANSYVYELKKNLFGLPPGKWPNWIIGNHNIIPRPTTRFGEEMIDGIHMIQLLLPGTPVIYMGDELGMTDIYLRNDQFVDVNSKQYGYNQARERNRTPIQWDSTAQAGFSNKTKTWLPINPNYVTLNVEYEQNSNSSHLKIFKELVNLRQLDVFRTGNVKFYEVSKYVFAFSRSNSILRSYFVVINLGSELENINLRKVNGLLPYKLTVIVASMYAEHNAGDIIRSESFTLRPSAAVVLKSSFFN